MFGIKKSRESGRSWVAAQLSRTLKESHVQCSQSIITVHADVNTGGLNSYLIYWCRNQEKWT
jgi:hypothetical protein